MVLSPFILCTSHWVRDGGFNKLQCKCEVRAREVRYPCTCFSPWFDSQDAPLAFPLSYLPLIFGGARIKATIYHRCCSINVFGFQRSRDSNNNNKRKKITVSHWFFLTSLNIKPQSHWPLTLHPVELSHTTSWFDLSGERNAASKMAYYQSTFCVFQNNIVKE